MKWVAKRKANRQGNGKVRETRTQREKEMGKGKSVK